MPRPSCTHSNRRQLPAWTASRRGSACFGTLVYSTQTVLRFEPGIHFEDRLDWSQIYSWKQLVGSWPGHLSSLTRLAPSSGCPSSSMLLTLNVNDLSFGSMRLSNLRKQQVSAKLHYRAAIDFSMPYRLQQRRLPSCTLRQIWSMSQDLPECIGCNCTYPRIANQCASSEMVSVLIGLYPADECWTEYMKNFRWFWTRLSFDLG